MDNMNIVERVENPGQEKFSPAEAIGSALAETLAERKDFYLFSPDETTSNRLEAVYNNSSRAWNLPKKDFDLPESADGHIIELLSENTLFACMVGHVLTGEPAMMTSYEAFFQIISSQLVQQLKFLKQASEVSWRPECPAINLLSTSTCWRQDHNGFSHQSPMLISQLLSYPGGRANCLFPCDDVSAKAAYNYMMSAKNVVNLTTFNKTDEPRWIDSQHAEFQLKNGGASIFEFASDKDPELIFTAAGDIATRETLYAMKILRSDLYDMPMRFVGIGALTHNAIGTYGQEFSQAQFNEYYTTNRPIIAAFHGYSDVLRQILASYTEGDRIFVHGFEEEGSTTTPFEMLTMNHASRYDIAADAARAIGTEDLAAKYEDMIQQNRRYARDFGEDLPEIREFSY